MQYFLSYF
uniref:Uncharacterized protein n=1 Tax=Triatoma infestans TaxID=30076 RepID=A0A161M927_TRIIF